MRYMSTIVVFAADNQYCLVLEMLDIFKWGMALNDHGRVDLRLQFLTEVLCSLLFVVAATVCQQQERYPASLKLVEGFGGLREGFGAAYEDAIDARLWSDE